MLRLLREVVTEPMFLLLVACGAIYMLLGDRHEAFMLLGFVFVVMGISFVQQRRAERSLDALRDLSSPRALVVRDGQPRRIAGRELVVGDVVLLAEGDRVPGDMRLVEASNLTIDESLLTGESAPVMKQAGGEAALRATRASRRQAPMPPGPSPARWSPRARHAAASWPPESAAHSAASASRWPASPASTRRSSWRRSASSSASPPSACCWRSAWPSPGGWRAVIGCMACWPA